MKSTKHNPYTQSLIDLLDKANWVEPTTKEYPTYIMAYKKHGRNAKAPYFEDIHFIWEQYPNKHIKDLLVSN